MLCHDGITVHLNRCRLQFLVAGLFFYDAPTPSGVFDELLAIPATGGNVSTSSFSDYFQGFGPSNDLHGHR